MGITQAVRRRRVAVAGTRRGNVEVVGTAREAGNGARLATESAAALEAVLRGDFGENSYGTAWVIIVAAVHRYRGPS